MKYGASEPLAARMRPRTLDEVVGQEHILGPGTLLRRVIEADRLTNIILFGISLIVIKNNLKVLEKLKENFKDLINILLIYFDINPLQFLD